MIECRRHLGSRGDRALDATASPLGVTDVHNIAQAIPSARRPLSRLSGPVEVVRQFTPNWFAATMGTGILALTLARFPGRPPALSQIAEGLWLFDVGLFAFFCLLYTARWIFFFEGARRIFGHSTMPMFFVCIP